MNVAMILAGGVGSRFGAKIPKQFIKVLDKPVLVYTIEAFEQHLEINSILVVCVKPYIDYIWELKEKYGLKKLKWVTEGGNTFQESVLNGVRYLENKLKKNDILLVHFGASPFITRDIITDCIRVCRKKGNAISTTDYYVLSGKKKRTTSVTDPFNYSEEYIDRETIAMMNSPHAFKYGYILNLYNEAISSGIIDKVEPHTTTLMYAMGEKIYFAYGSQNNIKITRKEDLELFEGYVLKQQRKGFQETKVRADAIVFLADGFEECEGLIVVDILRRAGLITIMASVMERCEVYSSRGIKITADCLCENVDYDYAQLIVLPGGRKGTEILQLSDLVKEKCVEFAKEKILAAICAAPTILAGLQLVKIATVHPDFRNKMDKCTVINESVVVDHNIVTGQGLGAAIPFALKIVEMTIGVGEAERIRKAICYQE